jgi:hypothetical protein
MRRVNSCVQNPDSAKEGRCGVTTGSTILKGVVHGKTIELDEDVGLPEGQAVSVILQPLTQQDQRLPPGEGIRRSAGAWADDPEGLDEYLTWLRQEREHDRTPIDP